MLYNSNIRKIYLFFVCARLLTCLTNWTRPTLSARTCVWSYCVCTGGPISARGNCLRAFINIYKLIMVCFVKHVLFCLLFLFCSSSKFCTFLNNLETVNLNYDEHIRIANRELWSNFTVRLPIRNILEIFEVLKNCQSRTVYNSTEII